MIERIYIEIGNICNLDCSFCPKLKRQKRQMSISEFRTVAKKISGHTKYAYLHVMGEPLLHKNLGEFLDILNEYGIRAAITTNGTLLMQKKDVLLGAENLHKVSISLHAPEANEKSIDKNEYLSSCINFARLAANKGVFVVFRLWNLDSEEGLGKNGDNQFIEDFLRKEFAEEWQKRRSGFRLSKNIFLEYDGLFTWPVESTAEENAVGYCHAIKDQLAILADGTVTPCCLDSEGEIPLGNIFMEGLDEIMTSERAVIMKKGFERRMLTEPLCKKCTYIKRFDR